MLENSELSPEDLYEMMHEISQEILAFEKEQNDYNLKLLEDHNIPREDFDNLVYDCAVDGKMEIVAEPKGNNQYENFGIFRQIFIDQWSTGWEGDSFAGHIYAKLEDNKWLKVPYYC